MKRKETYATTGSRMMVRFFGGWNFEPNDALSRIAADTGYTKGVPMGADLFDAPAGKAPTFLVAALKDPIGPTSTASRSSRAGSTPGRGAGEDLRRGLGRCDSRRPGADGKVPPVGNTVDVANAIWTNTIGDPELIAVWQDPDFDPKVRAFYYARVIEIPTPRWTAYDAKRFNIKMPPEVPMIAPGARLHLAHLYTPTNLTRRNEAVVDHRPKTEQG